MTTANKTTTTDPGEVSAIARRTIRSSRDTIAVHVKRGSRVRVLHRLPRWTAAGELFIKDGHRELRVGSATILTYDRDKVFTTFTAA